MSNQKLETAKRVLGASRLTENVSLPPDVVQFLIDEAEEAEAARLFIENRRNEIEAEIAELDQREKLVRDRDDITMMERREKAYREKLENGGTNNPYAYDTPGNVAPESRKRREEIDAAIDGGFKG